MVELIVGTYGVLCWLVLVKFKLVPINVYTIFTAMGGGVVILVLLYVTLSVFHPAAHDGRMYAPVVQIVPQVRGIVIEVPVEANKPLKKGDVLFRIDPSSYQFEVERLSASLATRNRTFSQDVEELARAEAATKEARAQLLASESKNDRQLRESHEQAKSQLLQVKDRLALSETNYERAKDAKAKGVIAGVDFDRVETNYMSQKAELVQAEAAERIASEELRRGSATLESTRQAVAQAEAAERSARTKVNTLIKSKDKSGRDLVTPEEREAMAQLEKARWDLEQTVVRAPTDGYVPQVLLRPGMMAVPFPVKPLMVFVVEERPSLVATYPQKVISEIKPGMQGEAVFKQYPGRSFKVKVRRVLTAIREGELDATGQIAVATSADAPGYVPVIFDYDEDVSNLNLPVGAQASIAIYTDRVHALSIVRKIILRMKSWENFVF